MLVSENMEKTPEVTAAQNMADRLADRIRNIWLDKTQLGIDMWEENFFEDADGIAFMRGEEFPGLQGIDYIFRWWGAPHDPDALAGELVVLWKIAVGTHVDVYKTWIRFAGRDFIRGNLGTEEKKRAANRKEFRAAFEVWQKCYMKNIRSYEEEQA